MDTNIPQPAKNEDTLISPIDVIKNEEVKSNKEESTNQTGSENINGQPLPISQDQVPSTIEEQKKNLNSDYYDEQGRPKYDALIQYENELRAEIEQTTPLVSDKLPMSYLEDEFKNSGFENSIKSITSRYKWIRTTRRDGNCFYRSFMFRLFEELSNNKSQELYEKVVTVVEESKGMAERQGYEWMVFEDFYNMFISEWKFLYQLDPENTQVYLTNLFQNKEKCTYMIVYIRLFIAAYIKENRLLYENFVVEESLDAWCLREVEPVDHECDQLQIMAVVNAFQIGVRIETLLMNQVDTMILPEDAISAFITMLFRPGHYDILYDN